MTALRTASRVAVRVAGVVLVSSLTSLAVAQAPSPSASAPSSSAAPSTSAAAAPSASVGAAPSASASALPPGHPNVGGDLPAGHPSVEPDEDSMFPKIPRDESREDAAVPAGSIVVNVRDANDQPIANEVVSLGILRTSVPEGEARSKQTAVTDAAGIARFADLKKGSGWAYRATVVASAPEDPSAIASYGSDPFQLPLDKGWSVVLHKFPVTTSIDQLLAAVEGVDTIVEVKDDVIEVQQVFDVINAGATTWSLGKGLVLSLPKGFKGLRSPEGMGDQQVVGLDDVGARWTGSFPPGRSRVVYDFKVPYEGSDTVDLSLETPPRVLAARVRTPTKKGMSLEVEGFPPAREEATATGVKVLSTIRQGSPQEPIRSIRIHVRGLPTAGPERPFAILGALAAVVLGLFFAFRAPPASDRRASAAARRRLRDTLLEELALLEKAHRAGEVGPKAYARERAKLVDMIADTLEPEPGRASASEVPAR